MVDRSFCFGAAIPNAKMYAMAIFREAIHEVVYLGKPADRGKVVLAHTKIYLAVLR